MLERLCLKGGGVALEEVTTVISAANTLLWPDLLHNAISNSSAASNSNASNSSKQLLGVFLQKVKQLVDAASSTADLEGIYFEYTPYGVQTATCGSWKS